MRTFRAWAYLAGFEEYNSRNHPSGKRSAYLYARWTYKARYLQLLVKTFFPNHQILLRAGNVAFSSPVSAVYAWSTWYHEPPFGEEICCIFWLGLSMYGSPSKKRTKRKHRYSTADINSTVYSGIASSYITWSTNSTFPPSFTVFF